MKKIKTTLLFNLLTICVFVIVAYLFFTFATLNVSQTPDLQHTCRNKAEYISQDDCNKIDISLYVLFLFVGAGLAHGLYVNRKILIHK